MAVVKINALEIPSQAGEEIVKRFSARIDELSALAGFEGFELLRPTAETESRWFVYTRWADEASYQAWRNSETFDRGHASSGGPGGAGSGRPGGGEHNGGGRQPVAMGATLLEFEVTLSAIPS